MQEITVKDIHKSLNTNGYICDVPFAARITSAMQTKPVSGAFLYGPAGTGKSYLPIVLSKTLGVEMFFYQCAPGTREDDLVLKMFPSETTKSGVEIKKSTVFKAAEASHKKKVMLVLDEWDKTRPTADGFFLDFLQYGRLSIPGTDINANLDNMFIFFTANDERDFHEALLRRFPKIDVDPLEPSLVMSALRLTHDGHPHLGNVIKLYEKAVMSGMSKPATIQEIRQLLDAISFLGDGADWNSLVYQYITKTPENHDLLKKAENTVYESNDTIAELKETKFEGEMSEDTKTKANTLMPKRIAYLTETEAIDRNKPIPNNDEIYAIYDYDDKNYSMLAHKDMQIHNGSDDVSSIDDFEVIHSHMIRKKPFQLRDIQYNSNAKRSKNVAHELCFVDKNCKFKDLLRLPYWGQYVIRRYSKNEVVARYISDDVDRQLTADMRWTSNNGLIIIVATKDVLGAQSYFDRNGRGNVGRLVNVTAFDTDNSVLKLVNDKNNKANNGILNLRNIINHEHIQYSGIIDDYSGDMPDCFKYIGRDTIETKVEANKTVYMGKNFQVSLENTQFGKTLICRVEIYGALKRNALTGIEILGRRMGAGSYGIPVYKPVRVNTRKLSKHLKRNGWRFDGSRAGLMVKHYKMSDVGQCFLFDDFAVFSFKYQSYDEYTDIKRFSKMHRIVHQLTLSASKHG
mgnify:FL=1